MSMTVQYQNFGAQDPKKEANTLGSGPPSRVSRSSISRVRDQSSTSANNGMPTGKIKTLTSAHCRPS